MKGRLRFDGDWWITPRDAAARAHLRSTRRHFSDMRGIGARRWWFGTEAAARAFARRRGIELEES